MSDSSESSPGINPQSENLSRESTVQLGSITDQWIFPLNSLKSLTWTGYDLKGRRLGAWLYFLIFFPWILGLLFTFMGFIFPFLWSFPGLLQPHGKDMSLVRPIDPFLMLGWPFGVAVLTIWSLSLIIRRAYSPQRRADFHKFNLLDALQKQGRVTDSTAEENVSVMAIRPVSSRFINSYGWFFAGILFLQGTLFALTVFSSVFNDPFLFERILLIHPLITIASMLFLIRSFPAWIDFSMLAWSGIIPLQYACLLTVFKEFPPLLHGLWLAQAGLALAFIIILFRKRSIPFLHCSAIGLQTGFLHQRTGTIQLDGEPMQPAQWTRIHTGSLTAWQFSDANGNKLDVLPVGNPIASLEEFAGKQGWKIVSETHPGFRSMTHEFSQLGWPALGLPLLLCLLLTLQAVPLNYLEAYSPIFQTSHSIDYRKSDEAWINAAVKLPHSLYVLPAAWSNAQALPDEITALTLADQILALETVPRFGGNHKQFDIQIQKLVKQVREHQRLRKNLLDQKQHGWEPTGNQRERFRRSLGLAFSYLENQYSKTYLYRLFPWLEQDSAPISGNLAMHAWCSFQSPITNAGAWNHNLLEIQPLLNGEHLTAEQVMQTIVMVKDLLSVIRERAASLDQDPAWAGLSGHLENKWPECHRDYVLKNFTHAVKAGADLTSWKPVLQSLDGWKFVSRSPLHPLHERMESGTPLAPMQQLVEFPPDSLVDFLKAWQELETATGYENPHTLSALVEMDPDERIRFLRLNPDCVKILNSKQDSH